MLFGDKIRYSLVKAPIYKSDNFNQTSAINCPFFS